MATIDTIPDEVAVPQDIRKKYNFDSSSNILIMKSAAHSNFLGVNIIKKDILPLKPMDSNP